MASPVVPLSLSSEQPYVAPRHAKRLQRGYVGITDAATYLDVTQKTIRKLIANGELQAYRLGNHVLKVRIADLDAVLRPVESRAHPTPVGNGDG
ncbi:MAG TPA: helix-turn-helix domain-containing protein [Mycobacterium sp.]|nr:helix-turn-helix domain-containing protein [Mycobacterium sp.]